MTISDNKLKHAIEHEFRVFVDPKTVFTACKLIAIALATSERYDVLATALSKESLDIDKIGRLINGLDQAVDDTSSICDRDKSHSTRNFNANRLWLLENSTKVVLAESNPISLQRAFLRYSTCLVELCIQHMPPSNRQHLQRIHFALKLLEARAEGRLEPWEGIVLVRRV
jgi:hypothetical protein